MPIGRPLSPVSVAGAHRRDDRRDDRGGDGRSPVKTAVVASTVGVGAAAVVHHRNKR